MIKLEKVEMGVFPYGSGSGMTMGHLHFKVDNEPVEDVKKSGEELIKKYKELVKAAGLESEAEDWYCGKSYWILSESGDSCLASTVNLPLFDELYFYLSKKSFEWQKGTLATTTQALPIAYFGTPKEYSGKDQFFERFNLIYVWAEMNPFFDALAEAEALRIPNSTLLFKPETVADVQHFMDKHVRVPKLPHLLSKFVAVIPIPELPSKEVIDAVMEAGLRLSFVPTTAFKDKFILFQE